MFMYINVIDKENNVIGIITDGDLRRLIDNKTDIMATNASSIMSKSPKTVLDDSLAVEAIELMEKFKITGFIVVNKHNKYVGAFNLYDLLQAKLL